MTYLLDTNVCIRYLTGRSEKVKQRLQQTLPGEIQVCSVVKAELFYGSGRSNNPEKSLQLQNLFLTQFNSLPLTMTRLWHMAEYERNCQKQAHPLAPMT